MTLPPHIHAQDRDEWHAWLEANHETASEIWVMYWKKGSGQPSIAWDDAVEVALCFGWIDGLIKSVDEHRYMQRWTPRRQKSKWSNVKANPEAKAQQQRLSPSRWERWVAWLDSAEGVARSRRLNLIVEALEARDYAAVDAKAQPPKA